MARLEIGGDNGWHSEEVDVFGRVFQTRRVSRAVSKKINALGDALTAAQETGDDDASFAAFADLMDALLEPTGGQKKTAGAVFREKWESDELFLDQLDQFGTAVMEAALRPPTQTPS